MWPVGADAVILSQDHRNFFHPNVIRSSVGTVFSNQIAYAGAEEIKVWCKGKNNIEYMPQHYKRIRFILTWITPQEQHLCWCRGYGFDKILERSHESHYQDSYAFNDSLNV